MSDWFNARRVRRSLTESENAYHAETRLSKDAKKSNHRFLILPAVATFWFSCCLRGNRLTHLSQIFARLLSTDTLNDLKTPRELRKQKLVSDLSWEKNKQKRIIIKKHPWKERNTTLDVGDRINTNCNERYVICGRVRSELTQCRFGWRCVKALQWYLWNKSTSSFMASVVQWLDIAQYPADKSLFTGSLNMFW